MARERVENILMRRDGISREEARDQVDECIEALESGDSEAIQYYLGLEDDYILDLI